MSPSCSPSAHHGSDNDAKPHATNNNPSHGYGIERFLADQEQYNPGFGKVQSPTEAEAIAETRMTAELRAFEKQFGSRGKPRNS